MSLLRRKDGYGGAGTDLLKNVLRSSDLENAPRLHHRPAQDKSPYRIDDQEVHAGATNEIAGTGRCAMQVKQFGLAALLAVTGATVAIGVIVPIAAADECDPTASICQGPDVQGTGSSPSFAPAPGLDTGGAPGEMQVTDENPGIASPGFEGGGGHR